MDSKPATEKKLQYRGGGKKIEGTRLTMGPWSLLDDKTRERYEAIEARVRDKVAGGEL